jgi:hypothetical protein
VEGDVLYFEGNNHPVSMQKKLGNKIFDVNGTLILLFIILVGAFAVAYIDLRKELVILREQALIDYFE